MPTTFATPFRVGLLVIVTTLLLFVFALYVRKEGLGTREAMTVHAYFRNASGLSKRSLVEIAGISVGEISKIQLEGNRAKVTLKVRRDVGLREDAYLTKRAESFLGDFLLDLNPGTDRANLMPDNGEILTVYDSQGTQLLFDTLTQVTADIKRVTQTMSDVLGGEKGADQLERIVTNLIRLSGALDEAVHTSSERLDYILKNVQSISADIQGVVHGKEQTINEIVDNLARTTSDGREVVASIKAIIGPQEGELKERVASVQHSLGQLDRVLTNLEEVTGSLKEGKSAAGALLTDKHLGQKVSDSLEDISGFVTKLSLTQFQIDAQAQYLFGQESGKSIVGLRIVPKPDKYYLFELVDDPRGVERDISTVTEDPANPGTFTTVNETTFKRGYKFSAEFAKRFAWSTLRFGVIESSGGVGADLNFPILRGAFTLKVDAFDFFKTFSGTDLLPRLRATLRFEPFHHIQLVAGMDDILNSPTFVSRPSFLGQQIGREFFAGGGIYFTDDDLKALITFAPNVNF